MDLEFQIDRIPPEGRDLRGHLDSAQAGNCLNASGDTGFSAPEGAALDLHIDKIERTIRITGHIGTAVVGACARCLGEARVPIDSAVDMTLFPATRDEGEDDEEELERSFPGIDDAGVQSGIYQGLKFDLTDTVRELLLLELPMRPLCSEDCAGLCDLCGKNLNQGACDCARQGIDPRWEKLKEIKVS